MPGALDLVTEKVSFPQGPVIMGTDIINSVNRPLDIAENNSLPLELYYFGSSFTHLGDFCNDIPHLL
jgi:hypothetical protein